MRQRLKANRALIILFLVALSIKLFSLNERWVERYYSTGIYPFISKSLRLLFGWIPFSVGDLSYIAAGVWLVTKAWRLVQRIRRRGGKSSVWMMVSKYLRLALLIYIVFSLGWGLNYNRQGIAAQLGLDMQRYSKDDLRKLAVVIQQRLIAAAPAVDSVERLRYNENRWLFEEGASSYTAAVTRFPFLKYSVPSLKPSLFTPVGHWFGFTGYYNPFSAEAQIKTDIPVFLKPFVTAHEIAHQVGYAKENEANFVAFLVCKSSGKADFLYSTYFDLYRDAIVEYGRTSTKQQLDSLQADFPQRVTVDILELYDYFRRNKNFIEPFMSGAYDNYLKLNNQPKGRATYNEVIAYLIAYAKKFGWEAL